jgi:hypothetical protein
MSYRCSVAFCRATNHGIGCLIGLCNDCNLQTIYVFRQSFLSGHMPPAARTTFLALFTVTVESDDLLPTNDPDVSTALDADSAEYNQGASKCLKEQRTKALACLYWLHQSMHLNHADVAFALTRFSRAPAAPPSHHLVLDYEKLSAKSKWQSILGRKLHSPPELHWRHAQQAQGQEEELLLAGGEAWLTGALGSRRRRR